MPKSTNKPRNPDDGPAALASRINGFIAAAAAVLVAIVGLTNQFRDQQRDKEKL